MTCITKDYGFDFSNARFTSFHILFQIVECTSLHLLSVSLQNVSDVGVWWYQILPQIFQCTAVQEVVLNSFFFFVCCSACSMKERLRIKKKPQYENVSFVLNKDTKTPLSVRIRLLKFHASYYKKSCVLLQDRGYIR